MLKCLDIDGNTLKYIVYFYVISPLFPFYFNLISFYFYLISNYFNLISLKIKHHE